MSLIGFHRFLIYSGITFCLAFSGYEFVQYSRSSSLGDLLLGIVFLTLGLLLAYYLSRLADFLAGKGR
ncbi:MAG: hypothetical protein F4179_12725 [Gammaproteobacteria bacterium]|nr:hypothetical protein [Gammaproteobacteria bacterium]MXY30513.1 hypothetical protein [Gammaproteobacteria bacterium]MYC99961.1 hypothetical protein [Gammaproteobacteria bacterium]MYF62507.1 hypothetical protein [Gammaproteobacteria bacterium]